MQGGAGRAARRTSLSGFGGDFDGMRCMHGHGGVGRWDGLASSLACLRNGTRLFFTCYEPVFPFADLVHLASETLLLVSLSPSNHHLVACGEHCNLIFSQCLLQSTSSVSTLSNHTIDPSSSLKMSFIFSTSSVGFASFGIVVSAPSTASEWSC